jgi:hypothetical protein
MASQTSEASRIEPSPSSFLQPSAARLISYADDRVIPRQNLSLLASTFSP